MGLKLGATRPRHSLPSSPGAELHEKRVQPAFRGRKSFHIVNMFGAILSAAS